jgi:hypothetical protein
VCQELGVNLVVGVGFLSITAVVKALQRVQQLRETLGGRPARIFYGSDFDPAGDNMPQSVGRQFEFWRRQYAPESDIKLKPVALTLAQCEQYDLPGVPTKAGDSRAAGFKAAYGRDATELDALEALHPGVLADLIREAVAPYRDEGLEDRLREAEAEAQTALDDAWEDATEETRRGVTGLLAPLLAVGRDGAVEQLQEPVAHPGVSRWTCWSRTCRAPCAAGASPSRPPGCRAWASTSGGRHPAAQAAQAGGQASPPFRLRPRPGAGEYRQRTVSCPRCGHGTAPAGNTRRTHRRGGPGQPIPAVLA